MSTWAGTTVTGCRPNLVGLLLVWGIVTLLLPAQCLSQEFPKPANDLTLAAALDEAYHANPTLKAAISQIPVAQGGILQAKTRVNPNLNLQAAPLENTYHPVDVSGTIQLGGKRELRIRVAKKQLELTQAQIGTTAWKVREDTEQAFFELAVAQKSLAVLQDYLLTAQRLVEITRKREQARDASGLDVLRAEAALADLKTQVAPAEARVHQAQRQLNILLNRAPTDPITITPPDVLRLQTMPTSLPDYKVLLAEAQTARPEYQQFAANMATQKAQVKLARAGWWPDVQIGGGISMVSATRKNYLGENFSYGPEMYAQIPIPVMNHQQGPRAIAQATYEQLQVQQQAFSNQVAQEVNLAYGNLDGAQRQIRIFLNETLPKQQEIVQTSQKSYGLGFLDLTGAVTAQQAALNTRVNFLQAVTRYFQSRVDLERAVGKPIDFEEQTP